MSMLYFINDYSLYNFYKWKYIVYDRYYYNTS